MSNGGEIGRGRRPISEPGRDEIGLAAAPVAHRRTEVWRALTSPQVRVEAVFCLGSSCTLNSAPIRMSPSISAVLRCLLAAVAAVTHSSVVTTTSVTGHASKTHLRPRRSPLSMPRRRPPLTAMPPLPPPAGPAVPPPVLLEAAGSPWPYDRHCCRFCCCCCCFLASCREREKERMCVTQFLIASLEELPPLLLTLLLLLLLLLLLGLAASSSWSSQQQQQQRDGVFLLGKNAKHDKRK
ncbi:hypothetical protein E2C01_067077 [Portunus trituberculatus]|uniref:Uncharacterized protein n=1 Tax=Portunus trituberculatus TaxID=210409 RepID=A0A5B7HSN5_PORTR|nr:hypothetical protein [Portunus trituberculatus]